jgi:hypothetical protein
MWSMLVKADSEQMRGRRQVTPGQAKLHARALPWPAVRALLALGGCLGALGIGLLVWGVKQQVAAADCRCVSPDAWPVTFGIFILIGGAAVAVWALAAGESSRVLHPQPAELEERDRLRRVGRAARARVLSAVEAGTSATGEQQLDVDLMVEVPGTQPYQVRHRTAVSRWWAWRLHIARPLRVFVDPEDPERLVVDWTLLRP